MEQEKLTPMQAYKVGDIVNYKVKSRFTNYCELIDEITGITSYLQGTAKLFLHKGQTIKCRVIAVTEKHPMIELVDISAFEQSKDNLTEAKLAKQLESQDISWNTKEFVKLLFAEEKDKSFESQCHKWIQGLLNKKIDLQIVRHDCSDLLELSDFLNICSNNERVFYQERLTLLIEQIGYYIKAAEFIDNDAKGCIKESSIQFIDDLFNKLRVSGFVYHPSKNFNILSCIFLRKPELMHNRMKELLDIISEKDIRIWEREPFSSALIKLLELYIKECDSKINKTKDNKELVHDNILALAVQLLLLKNANNNSIADYRLNAARLCVQSSFLNPTNTEKLVNAAYYNLFHSNAKLPVYTIGSVKMLPYYLINQPSNIDTINSFSQGNGRLIISENGIHLQASGAKTNLKPVFPKNLGLWKGIQVFLTSKTETSLASVKPNDLTPYQSVWAEIESEFFNLNKKPTVNSNKHKKQHRINDIVRITFTSQDINDRNKYYCQIEDEIGGNGYIYVKDIVPYSISTSLRHFYASDGSRYVFDAQIKDKEDDMFKFSMLEDLKSFLSDDYYSDDEDIICSVGNVPNLYGWAPAITKEGVSASIKNAGEFDGIKKNSIVRCRLLGAGSGTFHIYCEIVDYDSYDFDLTTAFKNLMEDCSVGKIPESITSQDEEQILESDRLIDESYVRGLVYMIARMALVEPDYVKSYNYLGFARIMCLLIGWESQAAYYKGRMDLVIMLHDFAQNSKVNEEKLAQLANDNAELFSNNVVLRERYMQLLTVSYLNKEKYNTELFKLSESNPSLKALASLVLAYNITKSNKLESSATDIHNKIIQLLNLKGYETGLKLYGNGEETEECEYKTSFIFHAEDGCNIPNQEKQKEEILKVINSFFNTRGGTLYIGVNNSGYGVGIEEDLNTSIYNNDKDKYIRSIVDAIALEWGNSIAATYIKLSFDENNTNKDVLIIEILPIESGLAYKNMWYVRKAGSKRKLTEKEFNEYRRIGRKVSSAPKVEELKEEVPANNPPIIIPSTSTRILKDDEIKTSRIRKNVLEDWKDPDNYVDPIGFFKFISGGKFCKLDDYDYDEESLLTLAVKESEYKGYLVLGYGNGKIVKVSVEELLDYNNREYARYTESKLMFASIANKDDCILTITKENKTKPKVLMRLDRLSVFYEGKLMDSGEALYNEGLASEVLSFEIIPYNHTADFKGILDKPKTMLGQPSNGVTKGMVNKLHLWGITEI